MSTYVYGIIATLIWSGFSLPAMGYQPKGVMRVEQKIPATGPSRQIAGSITIQNVTANPLIAEIPTIRSADYSFKFEPSNILLKPGQKTEIKFTGFIQKSGKWQIIAPMRMLSEQGQLASVLPLDFYFLVKENTYELSTYAKLFLQFEERDPEMGESFHASDKINLFPRSQEWQIKKPLMEELLTLERENIFKIPTESAGRIRDAVPYRNEEVEDEGAFIERYGLDEFNSLNSIEIDANDERENAVSRRLYDADSDFATINAQGVFSWSSLSGLLNPAFGWRVKAWNRIGPVWVKVAEDWIQWNGAWNLSFSYSSGPVKFQYVAYNRFFTPQTSSAQTFRWVGPQRASVSTTHNEGSWFANTTTGGARGLGEVYDEGMRLWSRLYHTGGIDPLRGSSIKVVYPNTAYDCGDGSGIPWSCANTGGTIWLIPAHASRNGVMQHELSHQINYEYWNNQLPPASGGSHSLGSCYTPGLALTEGFANFMVFWTQASRSTAPFAGFDFAIENPSFACTTLNRNEAWVAANLWDLHDKLSDSLDGIHFIHEGAVPGLYLRTGKRDSMALFHPTYRNAANAEHRTIVDNIFKQNKIIP